MIPVVTPSEMAKIDTEASEPINVLIERAGNAVAWHARKMLKGTYGKRVTVIAGNCLLYTSPSPRDGLLSRMPSSA